MPAPRLNRAARLGVFALTIASVGCGGDSGVDLFVDLQTDFLAGAEFAAVRTTLVDEGHVEMEPAFRGRSYLEGQRVAELTGLEPGMRTVLVELLDSDGAPIASRRILLRQEDDVVLEALLTRDCAGLDCSCFGGVCAAAECVTGNEPVCPDAECTADSDCTMGASCSSAVCQKGRCVSTTDDTQCSGDQYCHPDNGCTDMECVEDCLTGPIALYELDEGAGEVAHDTSGRDPPLDLRTFTGTDAAWIDGGVRLAPDEPLLATLGPATRLGEACRATDELTLSVWLRTDVLEQGGPARIVTYSVDTAERNFTLGHGEVACSRTGERAAVGVRLRLDDEANACSNTIRTSDPSLTPDMTHVVFTRANEGGRRIYIDGAVAADDVAPGDFDSWIEARLLFGAEDMDSTLLRRWDGELHHVAIWNRALTSDEVARLHGVGPDDFASF